MATAVVAAPVVASSHDKVIYTTTNHPWLTTECGWAHAGDLRPGEQVVTPPGQTANASNAPAATISWVRVALEAITPEDAIAWFAYAGYALPAQPT